MTCKYLLHSVGCLFILTMVPLAFGGRSTKTLLRSMSRSLVPISSFRNCVVSGLLLKSLLHFESNVVHWWRYWSGFILLHQFLFKKRKEKKKNLDKEKGDDKDKGSPEELAWWRKINQLLDLLPLSARLKRHLEIKDWNTGEDASLDI